MKQIKFFLLGFLIIPPFRMRPIFEGDRRNEAGLSHIRLGWLRYRYQSYHVGIYVAAIKDQNEVSHTLGPGSTQLCGSMIFTSTVKGLRAQLVRLAPRSAKSQASGLFWRTFHGISPVALDFVHFSCRFW